MTASLRRCRDRLVVRLWWRTWTGRIPTASRAGNAVRYGAQAGVRDRGHDLRRAGYSITSLARARSDGGTSRPSALAVLRLITSSYLVGAWTGRSAGFSPLRMRSAYSVARRTGSRVSGPQVIRPPSLA